MATQLAGRDLRKARFFAAWAILACFCVLFATRLQLIASNGFAHPFWDQWGGEGVQLIQPLLEKKLTFAQLIAPASEHRIVLQRLSVLMLVKLDGFWDCVAQLVLNAAIFSFFATFLIFWLIRISVGLERWLLAGALFAVFCSPIGFQNTLWGIASYLYFSIFFSFVAIIGASQSRPFSTGWFVAFAAAVAAFLGSAGGVITPLICAGITVLRWFQLRESLRRHVAAILGWLTLGAVLFSLTPHVPGNQLAAKSASEFCAALFGALAFPFAQKIWGIPPIVIIGLLATAALVPSRRFCWRDSDRAVLGILVWLLGQSVVIACLRGHGAIPHRYHDVLVLFVPFALAGLSSLPRLLRLNAAGTAMSRAVLAGLVALYFVGLAQRTDEAWRIWIPQRTAGFAVQENNLRDFVRTENFEVFGSLSADDTGSYLGADAMSRLLQTESVRHALAPSIREPVPITSDETGEFLKEPFSLATFRTSKLSNGYAGCRYLIICQSRDRPSIWARLTVLGRGLILRAGPDRNGSHSIELITRDWNQLRGSKILDKLGVTSCLLPREIGPVGSAARLLLSFSPVLLIAGSFGLASFALIWFSRRTSRNIADVSDREG